MNSMRHSVEVRQDSRKWLLELLPLWNEEVISHIASEQDLETAYLKKLVISHIYKPFQESLVLIDNDNAEQVRCVPCVEEKKERNSWFLRRKARNKEILNDLCNDYAKIPTFNELAASLLSASAGSAIYASILMCKDVSKLQFYIDRKSV
ncbi:hypothetical protein ACFE04_002308 [Oxalis oulophora]